MGDSEGPPTNPRYLAEYPGKAGQFWVPHSLTLVEDMNMLCVADRENERIQCFTAGLENRQHPRNVAPTGTFVTKAEGLGRVYAVRYEGMCGRRQAGLKMAASRPQPVRNRAERGRERGARPDSAECLCHGPALRTRFHSWTGTSRLSPTMLPIVGL